MMRLILTSFLLGYALFSVSQEKHGDCSNSLMLKDLSYSSEEVKGFGEKLEFSGNDIGNSLYFSEEHNSFWAVFNAPYDGDMTLTIKGDPKEDWDFLLYEANLTQCQDIADQKIEPIRTNLARNDKTGLTGLDITYNVNLLK